MDHLPNSAAARDISYLLHPNTNARKHEKTGPIMEKRISGAITGVASLITQAWTDAGKPALPVEPPPRPPRPIKR